jgi:hypothetical protein
MSLDHLVTVFCTRDWAQFCLQVESLKLLAEPLTQCGLFFCLFGKYFHAHAYGSS